MHSHILEYLKTLISYQSVTPASNGAIEYIADILQEVGFSVDIQLFGNSEYKVTNLYASYGQQSPNICFAGHIDVVPPGNLESWNTDPFIATKIGDKIFGRGAVDMKGAVACMIAASLDFIKLRSQIQGTISFLITSDEEGEAKYGTAMMLKYLRSQQKKIDLAIVGEPTAEKVVGDIIKIGRRGSINFLLRIEGKQGHVAYPNKAINPLRHLTNIMHDLINIPLDQGNEFFSPSNLEIVSIDTANEAVNVIPFTACAKFNIRFNNIHNLEDLKSKIEQIITKYTQNYILTSQCSALPFIQPLEEMIVNFQDIVRTTTGANTILSTGGGTSDARFIKDHCLVIECGLLSDAAHTSNEYVKIKDLQKLYNVYYNFLSKFLKA